MPKSVKAISNYIRTIANFPHQGILFRDVTTLFADADGLHSAVDAMVHLYKDANINKVVALEARGFIIGAAVAYQLGLGFVPIRKSGKLPADVIGQDYQLEYGNARVEIHKDALAAGEKVLLIDDLLATGGTAKAGIILVERLGAQVTHCGFIVELAALNGRKVIEKSTMDIDVLCTFDSL